MILYEKDPKTKIATITINRPDKHNAMTIPARHRFSDLVHRANIDDDVKVLVVRGVGDHFGTGDDLPEMAPLFSDKQEVSWLHDFRIGDDEGVKYPPKGSYRYLAGVTHLYSRTGEGMRDFQDFKKISIVEAKGYCYGWHFYLAGDADFVIASDDALFGHASFRYAGWAARMWQWTLMMGLRKFQEMVFTGRPFTAQDMYDCNFVNSVVPRDQIEAEVQKYALACAHTRPTDTVVMQKTFFEVFKQQQGEYMGSILSAWLESMLPAVKNDGQMEVGDETFDKGLSKAVKDNDSLFPPDWRLSYAARKTNKPKSEIEQMREQLAAQQERILALEQKLAGK
jgi:enoyl-CoA hydratase/carnithine racemase